MAVKVELNASNIIKGLIIAAVTAVVVLLWNIDSRVKVLEQGQDMVDRVERLETAMLPVLATWKAEEMLKKEREREEDEWIPPRYEESYPDSAVGGDEPSEEIFTEEEGEEEEEEGGGIRRDVLTRKEMIEKEAEDWAKEQLQQRPIRGD